MPPDLSERDLMVKDLLNFPSVLSLMEENWYRTEKKGDKSRREGKKM